MSIIRLSVMQEGVYAPDERGIIDDPERAFTTRAGKDGRGKGRMELTPRTRLADERSDLGTYLRRSLEVEAAALTDDRPLVVMVHGFQFDPAAAFFPPWHRKADNPHCRVFHFTGPEADPRNDLATQMKAHSTGWPLGLGMAAEDAGADGLAVAFGWDSAPGIFESLFGHVLNPYSVAYRRADEFAAWQLVALLEALVALRPRRRIDLFCHSLGSRVVVRALAKAADEDTPEGLRDRLNGVVEAIDRVLILAGAEYVKEAQLMMRRLNAGREGLLGQPKRFARTPAFYNIVSRENDVLDVLGENFGPRHPGSTQAIGHNGLEMRDPGWIDIQLDDPGVARWFRERGHSVTGDNETGVLTVADHWIHFTWPGNMAVYRAILRDRGAWEIADLKQEAPAEFDRVRLNRGSMAA